MTPQARNQNDTSQKAVIYARVSSPAQVKRGHGLDSQESTCRSYAAHKGYEVEVVFRDEGISGGLIDRPGMQEMLRFLRKHKRTKQYVVIIDDISRLARDIRAHLDLRDAITNAGAKLESPAIEFGEDSSGRYVENILALSAQLEREKNAERVVDRMRARLMSGYYGFAPVLGYHYKHVSGHGKMLVPDKNGPIVKEALEGFASGRFQSPTEVKRFLEKFPSIPKNKNGEVRLQRAIELLQRPLYAGYITVPKWDVYLHPAKHEALIDFATFQKIQDRLKGVLNGPARKDLNEDFPLRGFVTCSHCEQPLTAAWSKGRNKHYAYYTCQTKGCEVSKKSIRKEQIEGDFEVLLKKLQPAPCLLRAVWEMLSDAWDTRRENANSRTSEIRKEIAKIERKTKQLMERIVSADSTALINAYEDQIKKLEEDKIILAEKSRQTTVSSMTFEQTYRTAIAFLANPRKIWSSDVLAHKRMVLRLAFPHRLAYCKNEGYRTAGIAEPFRLLGALSEGKYGLVGPEGLEPPT